jgi:hypothetical protein
MENHAMNMFRAQQRQWQPSYTEGQQQMPQTQTQTQTDMNMNMHAMPYMHPQGMMQGPMMLPYEYAPLEDPYLHLARAPIPALAPAPPAPSADTLRRQATIEREKIRNRKNASDQRRKQKTAADARKEEIQTLHALVWTMGAEIADCKRKLLKFEGASDVSVAKSDAITVAVSDSGKPESSSDI